MLMQHETQHIEQLLAQLREAGEKPKRALRDAVRTLGPVVAPALIGMATDRSLHEADQESPEIWAPLHAIRLLGEMGTAEAIDPLLALLTDDQHGVDDWLDEVLLEYFSKIGRPAVLPLRTVLFGHSADTAAQSIVIDALVKMAQAHLDLRDEVVATLTARLDPAESRAPEDETVNAFVISALLDLQAAEARPAILQAFDDDRVDYRIVDVDSVAAALGLPAGWSVPRWRRGNDLLLWLRCTACRYERPHQIEKVYYDLNTLEQQRQGQETPYSEFVIPQRITCPKCGAVDQYELTAHANLALMAESLKSLASAQAPEDDDLSPFAALGRLLRENAEPSQAGQGHSRLIPTRFKVAGGREMHPYAAREMYERQVAQAPRRADLRVRYGNVLRFLGQNDDAAVQYRAAVESDESNVEAYANLGVLARMGGNRTEARRMFERVLELVPGSRISRQEREDYLLLAHEELAALYRPGDIALPPMERGLGSPREQGGRAHGGIATTVRPVAPVKVGRNDPCPCGSGLKYKKCCGR